MSMHFANYKELTMTNFHFNEIDRELFAGLDIGTGTLDIWFDDIQHLTNEEKVGLWFLVRCSGHNLTSALEILQDGMIIFSGGKEDWVSAWQRETNFRNQTIGQHYNCIIAASVQEFRFGGETWCAKHVPPSF